MNKDDASNDIGTVFPSSFSLVSIKKRIPIRARTNFQSAGNFTHIFRRDATFRYEITRIGGREKKNFNNGSYKTRLTICTSREMDEISPTFLINKAI